MDKQEPRKGGAGEQTAGKGFGERFVARLVSFSVISAPGAHSGGEGIPPKVGVPSEQTADGHLKVPGGFPITKPEGLFSGAKPSEREDPAGRGLAGVSGGSASGDKGGQ